MSSKKVISVIKDKCKQAPARAPDYQDELMDKVAEIVWAERQHIIRSTNIQKIVTDYCEVLGEYIYRKTGDDSG